MMQLVRSLARADVDDGGEAIDRTRRDGPAGDWLR